MKNFITLCSFAFLISAYMGASESRVALQAVPPSSLTFQEMLDRVDRALIVAAAGLPVPDVAVVHGTTSAHAASRALNRIGNMYVAGGSDLSPTERVVLGQARFVSTASFGVAVVGAAAKSEIAQKAAVLGLVAKTLETGYVFWRGYNRLPRQ